MKLLVELRRLLKNVRLFRTITPDLVGFRPCVVHMRPPGRYESIRMSSMSQCAMRTCLPSVQTHNIGDTPVGIPLQFRKAGLIVAYQSRSGESGCCIIPNMVETINQMLEKC